MSYKKKVPFTRPFNRYKKTPAKSSNVSTVVSDSDSDSDTTSRILNKNGYKLVIVESPAKCSKIESFLGKDYKCIASFGHFREITSPDNIRIDIHIDTNTKSLNVKYTNIRNPSARKAMKTMKTYAEKASQVIIATDDDREGEAIGWHICSLLKLDINTTPRAIFHEITHDAVVSGVEGSNRVRINMDLVRAQQARQAIDMIVGYGVTPALWASGISGSRKNGPVLSGGRCQTPALQLVIDEDKISKDSIDDSFKFKVHGLFTRKNIRFDLTQSFENKDDSIEFLSDSVTHKHTLLPSPPLKTSIRSPPKPLTTSRLQQAVSNAFSLSPKQTMSSCQRLYEGGHITYMRTDASAYSEEFIDAAKRYIEQTFNDTKFISPNVDTFISAGSGAHESIRPTNATLRKLPETVTELHDRKIYELIWETSISSLMSPAEYSRLVVRINSPSEDYHYETITETAIFLGWEVVHPRSSEIVNKELRDYTYLKSLIDTTNPDTIPFSFIRAIATPSTPKPRPTEARLVRLLEERGIGRPSTFSSLVEKIQDRGYVKRGNIIGTPVDCETYEITDDSEDVTVEVNERMIGAEKNKLLVNPVGTAVAEYLQTHFSDLFNYDYTSNMESRLELIAAGRENAAALCAEVRAAVNAAVAAAPTSEPPAPPPEEEPDSESGWEYENLSLKVKKGRYGLFARWGDVTFKLPFGSRPMNNIRYDEVVDVLKRRRNLK
jgi:DNA topoisomerase I